MTNYEKETVINFNEAEKEASIYTFNKKMISKLDRLCEKFPEQFRLYRKFSDGAREYIMPKKYVSVRGPRPQKELSEAEKEQIKNRLLNSRKSSQKTT